MEGEAEFEGSRKRSLERSVLNVPPLLLHGSLGSNSAMFQDDGLDEFSAALAAAGVRSELFHDCIHIPLLEGQGLVEVKSWGGRERSVQLFKGRDSRDLTVAPREFDCEPTEAVERLLQRLTECGVHAQPIGEE